MIGKASQFLPGVEGLGRELSFEERGGLEELMLELVLCDQRCCGELRARAGWCSGNVETMQLQAMESH